MTVKVRTNGNWLHFGLTDVQHLKLDAESTVGDLHPGHYYGGFHNALKFETKDHAKKYVKDHKLKMFKPHYIEYSEPTFVKNEDFITKQKAKKNKKEHKKDEQ